MKSIKIFALLLLFTLSAATSAYAHYGGGYGFGPGMMGWGFGHGMGWFGPIIMIAFWVVLIIGIVYLIRWIAGSTGSGSSSGHEAPLDILKKRYARGEISKEEFEQMKKDLS